VNNEIHHYLTGGPNWTFCNDEERLAGSLMRARVAVAAADKEYHDALAAIAAHEAPGGDDTSRASLLP
jgi:hypothetical protein